MAGQRDAVTLHHRLDDGRVAAGPLSVDPVHLVHGDELLDQGAREVAAALVIAHDELHGGAAETREALARPEGDVEIRVVVVDDVLDGLIRPEVLLTEAREVSREREQNTDEDFLRRLRLGPLQRETAHHHDGRQDRDEDPDSAHGLGPPRGRG
jgi:hypothetical protein